VVIKATQSTSKRSLESLLASLQQDLARYYLDKIESVTETHPNIQDHIKKHEQYFLLSPLKAITEAGLRRFLKQARILCVGDYHAFCHSQNEFLHLLELAHRGGLHPMVLLESLPDRQERQIQKFWNQTLTVQELLEEMEFKDTWGFDSLSTERILLFCKSHGVPFGGMNPTHPSASPTFGTPDIIRHRELQFSQTILRWVKKYPNKTLMVLMGNLHLLPNNFPQVWKLKSRIPIHCIHQNIDEVFLRKLTRGPFKGRHLFQMDAHNLVIINSHPWHKHHSYWKSIESTLAYDISPQELLEERELNLREQCFQILGQLMKLTRTGIPEHPFHIYIEADQDLRDVLTRSRKLNGSQRNFYTALFDHRLEFALQSLDLVYLPFYTSNTLVDICFKWLCQSLGLWVNPDRGTEEDFYRGLIQEAQTFMVGRLLNPSRSAPRLEKLTSVILPKPKGRNTHDASIPNQNLQSKESLHQWHEIYQSLEKFPHRQWLLIQWLGRHWGAHWTPLRSATTPNLRLELGPNTLRNPKAHLLRLLKSRPFSLE
jgi:hypothetical protein